MATIKSYTDLVQSKKLAEILPIESADMYWQSNLNSSDRQYLLDMGEEEYFDIEMNFEHFSIGDYDIPAWSLAALFNALPKLIGDYSKCLYYGIGGYYCGYMNDGDFMLTIKETTAANPVDACYKMVLKLSELNLL